MTNLYSNQKLSITQWLLVAGGLLVIGGVSGIGSYLGNQLTTVSVSDRPSPIDLHAGAAIGNDSLSMATGLITSEVEGLWLLDHASGNLQCWVMSPRTGDVAGVYATNVANDLELSKGRPEFLMAAGSFFFTGGTAGNLRPANSICYVSNTNSGIVAGYSVAINQQALKRGVAVSGKLSRVCIGKISEGVSSRDQ